MKISKQESTAIKGVALIMMIIHHSWNTTLVGHLSLMLATPPEKIFDIISGQCKLCVAVFAFLSGWIFWELKEKFCSYRYIARKCIQFLIAYWVVVLCFVLIGIISSDNMPDIQTFMFNLFGFKVGAKEIMHYDYVNVVFAWYVRFYVCVLLTTPIILRLISKERIHYSVLILVSILLCLITFHRESFILKDVLHIYFQWIPCVLVGIFCNKYKWMNSMQDKNKYILFFFFIALLCLRFKKMTFYGDISLDFVLVVFFIYYLKLIFECMNKKNVWFHSLVFLGSLSMNLWYCHSIFFIPSHKWTWMIRYTDNCILIIVSIILLSVPFAVICEYIQNHVNKNILKI